MKRLFRVKITRFIQREELTRKESVTLYTWGKSTTEVQQKVQMMLHYSALTEVSIVKWWQWK